MKLLIVEDQVYPLQALKHAVNTVLPQFVPDYQKGDFAVARSYTSAQEYLKQDQYDVVLLDHRLPLHDTGNLEDTDFDRFSASLRNVGYQLIEYIRTTNPQTLIIGTSSLNKDELRGFPAPDHTMSKMFGEAKTDLERILGYARNE